MKTIKIIYWISTGLILALMLVSAIGSFMNNPEGAKMMADLGYKLYIIHFLAVAKILGIIAILVPGFPRLKEWAYAGFAFDLIGATYSMYASNFPVAQWAPMFIYMALLACSYIYYHKKIATPKSTDAVV
ncbi:MAG TPA: DoxX family protein [Mucilaginibacter sp.]|jgi:hypothetical protein